MNTTNTTAYQRTVHFTYRGTRGFCDKNDWVVYGTMGCHLDELSIESGVRQVIHKLRNNEPYHAR